MFPKKKKVEEPKKAVKPKEIPKPEEIEEVEEEFEEPVVEETRSKKLKPSTEEVEEEELTEEAVKEYFSNIAKVLQELTYRVQRIEHHLRLDF